MSDVALFGMLLAGAPDLAMVAILPPVAAGMLLMLLISVGIEVAPAVASRSGVAVPAASAAAVLLPTLLLLSDHSLALYGGDVWDIVPLAFLSLLSGTAVMHCARAGGDPRWAALASLFAGGAGLLKYSGFVLLAVLPFALLLVCMPRGIRSKILLFLAGALPGVALVSLVLLRNALRTGNPFFPFLTETFGGPGTEVFDILLASPPPGCPGPGLRGRNLLFLAGRSVFLIPAAALLLARPPRWAAAPALLGLLYLAAIGLGFDFGGSYYRYAFLGIPLVATAAPWLLCRPATGLLKRVALLLLVSGLAISAQTASALWYDACVLPGPLDRGSWTATPLLWTGPGAAFDDSKLQPLIIGAALIWALMLSRRGGMAPESKRPGDGGASPARGARTHPGRLGRDAAPVLALLLITLPGIVQAWQVKHPLAHDGEWTHAPDEVLEAYWGADYRMWVWMDANLPPGSRVYTFENHRLHCQTELADAASLEFAPLLDGLNRSATLAFLKAHHITHVLDLHLARGSYWTSELYEHSSVFRNIQTSDYRLLHREGENYLYRVV